MIQVNFSGLILGKTIFGDIDDSGMADMEIVLMVDRDTQPALIDFLDTCIDHEPTELDKFVIMLDRDDDKGS
jgi:hypothetical protein